MVVSPMLAVLYAPARSPPAWVVIWLLLTSDARAGVSEVMNIIGDVSGKDCILIDDIIDSGGTLCNAAQAIIDEGQIC